MVRASISLYLSSLLTLILASSWSNFVGRFGISILTAMFIRNSNEYILTSSYWSSVNNKRGSCIIIRLPSAMVFLIFLPTCNTIKPFTCSSFVVSCTSQFWCRCLTITVIDLVYLFSYECQFDLMTFIGLINTLYFVSTYIFSWRLLIIFV